MSIETAQAGPVLERLRIVRRSEPARGKRRPIISFVILVVAAAFAGGATYTVYSRTAGRPLPVQTILVESGPTGAPGVKLTGSGYVVTRHKYITIGTKILGQIVEEPIEEGQRVKAGDVLARIDDRDYQAQLRQAVAMRNLAEANVRLTESRVNRLRKLHGTGAISEDDLETAVNAAEVARAQLERDNAAVDYAKFNVNQCVISSPINGLVLKKYRELGDTINYGGQLQAGGGATDIAQLADTEDMRAEVDINEADIAKVELGSPAVVAPDAYSERRFEALLVKIYPEADRQKGTVKVEVRIDKPDLQVIKPELSVKVSFLEPKPVAAEASEIRIPKSAVKIEGSSSYVWTVHDGEARRAAVVPGRELETGIEVKKGLNSGEMVIVAPPANLREGQKVIATASATAAGGVE